MWWIPMTILFLVWGFANLVFAFVDPPAALARFMPRKVWFFFALLPEPWDRRLGLLFNFLLGCGGAAFFLYLGLVT